MPKWLEFDPTDNTLIAIVDVLSSLPAWRLVDPLSVFGSLGEDFDDDDESFESIVDNGDGDDP